MGRPSNIDTIVGTNEAGEPITVWQKIVEAVRIGSYLEPAIRRSGVATDTAYGWLQTAGRVRIKHKGNIDARILTPHEEVCLAFSDALDEAEGMWEVAALAIHERLVRGGIAQVSEVEETDSAGNTIKKRVTTSHTLPDARAIEWRLAHRHRERWSQRIELTGDIGVTVNDEARTEQLVETLDAYLAGIADEKQQVKKPARKPKAARG